MLSPSNDEVPTPSSLVSPSDRLKSASTFTKELHPNFSRKDIVNGSFGINTQDLFP